MPKNLTESDFESTIENNEGTAVVQFTAPWCGPCRMLTPRLEKLEADGHFTYYKVDVDEQPGLARDFRIMSIPTLYIYHNNGSQSILVGAKTEKEILEAING